jgi:hypothetical protein
MEERLDDISELAVPNFGDSISKLIARHEWQQIVPILQSKFTEQWKFTEIVWIVELR